jgi:hypothetical protein
MVNSLTGIEVLKDLDREGLAKSIAAVHVEQLRAQRAVAHLFELDQVGEATIAVFELDTTRRQRRLLLLHPVAIGQTLMDHLLEFLTVARFEKVNAELDQVLHLGTAGGDDFLHRIVAADGLALQNPAALGRRIHRDNVHLDRDHDVFDPVLDTLSHVDLGPLRLEREMFLDLPAHDPLPRALGFRRIGHRVTHHAHVGLTVAFPDNAPERLVEPDSRGLGRPHCRRTGGIRRSHLLFDQSFIQIVEYFEGFLHDTSASHFVWAR